MRINDFVRYRSFDSGVTPFVADGYLACLVGASIFILALFNCFSGLEWQRNDIQTLLSAIGTSSAAVLASIVVAFEVRAKLRSSCAANPLLALGSGILAAPIVIAATRLTLTIGTLIALLAAFRILSLIVQSGWRRATHAVLAGGLVGYWAFLISYVDGYKTPWIDEAILSGRAHVDILFNTSIVNMLSTYGLGSTGVDGLSTFPYHFGSHRFVSLLAPLLNISPIDFYSVVFPLLFAPLFILALFFFVVSFRGFLQAGQLERTSSEAAGGAWFWWLFAIFFIGILPIAVQRDIALWDNIFHSESFGVAMLFAYFACIYIFERLRQSTVWNPPLSAALIIAVYLLILSTLKISVAFIIAACILYMGVRTARSIRQRLLILASILPPLAWGFWMTRDGGSEANNSISLIKPLAFVRDSVGFEFRGFAFFVFFSPFIAFFLLRLTWTNCLGFADFRRRLKAFEYMDLEFVAAITVVALGPGLVLSIPQGSTNFFSEVSYWIILPVLVTTLSSYLASTYGVNQASKMEEK